VRYYHKCAYFFTQGIRYACQILSNLNFLDRFWNNTQIPNFMKIRPVRAEFHEDGWTDMTRLIVAICNFATAPKNSTFCPPTRCSYVFLTFTTTVLSPQIASLGWFLLEELQCLLRDRKWVFKYHLHNLLTSKAVSWPRRSVAGPSPRRPGFHAASVLVRLVMDKAELGQFFSEYFGLPLSVSFRQCSIPLFISMLLLPEGQMGEA
jgi:hypothetical protein